MGSCWRVCWAAASITQKHHWGNPKPLSPSLAPQCHYEPLSRPFILSSMHIFFRFFGGSVAGRARSSGFHEAMHRLPQKTVSFSFLVLVYVWVPQSMETTCWDCSSSCSSWALASCQFQDPALAGVIARAAKGSRTLRHI